MPKPATRPKRRTSPHRTLLEDDNLFRVFPEPALRTIGLDDKVVEALAQDPYQNHPQRPKGYLGVLVLNYLSRQGVWNHQQAEGFYLSAIAVADELELGLSSMMRTTDNGRALVTNRRIDGVEDLCVAIADLHFFSDMGANKTPQELAVAYATTKNVKLIPPLVEGTWKLVPHIANRFWETSVPEWMKEKKMIYYEDLIESGNEGLMLAVEGYNPNHTSGARFSTYACNCIEDRMKACITDKKRRRKTIERRHYDIATRMKWFINLHYTRHGEEPSYEDMKAEWVRNEFPLDLFNYFYVHRHFPRTLRLDKDYNDGQQRKPWSLHETVEAEPDYNVIRARQLKAAFALDLRELPISRRHQRAFYRMVFDELTLESTGDLAGVTRERVRQLDNKYFQDPKYFTRTRALLGIPDEIALRL